MFKFVAFAALALAAASPAAAAVTYDFTSYAQGPFHPQAGFSFTVDDFIVPDTTVPASSLTSCDAPAACNDPGFFRGPTNEFGPGHDLLAFGYGQNGAFYTFDPGAFSTLGIHYAYNPDLHINAAQLIVSEAAPALVRRLTRLGAAHCNSRVSSIRTTRSCVPATSARSALTSVGLPVEVPPATRMLRRVATAARSSSAASDDMIPAAT